jgi:hypothetical protein
VKKMQLSSTTEEEIRLLQAAPKELRLKPEPTREIKQAGRQLTAHPMPDAHIHPRQQVVPTANREQLGKARIIRQVTASQELLTSRHIITAMPVQGLQE